MSISAIFLACYLAPKSVQVFCQRPLTVAPHNGLRRQSAGGASSPAKKSSVDEGVLTRNPVAKNDPLWRSNQPALTSKAALKGRVTENLVKQSHPGLGPSQLVIFVYEVRQ
jgi:hypothetical protein